MRTMEYLPTERLENLPESYWLVHEFCFYLHDTIAHMFVQYDQADAQNTVRNTLEKFIKEKGLEEKFEGKNLLELFKNDTKAHVLYKKHVLSHVIMALTSDMLHFLYEALSCIEKRKFSVAFAMLRKPFKEHLFFLSWILADENDFIRRFEVDNYKSFKLQNVEDKKQIIQGAIKHLHTEEVFDGELIWDFIFSKQHENGFEPTWQRATHLTTSMGSLLKTEDLSLNFIFENPSDDFYFGFLENGLPYLMFYMVQVTLACFDKVRVTNNKTVNHLIFSSLGVFECLDIYDSHSELMETTQDIFKEFLRCIHCDTKLKLNKDNFSRLLVKERFVCEHCQYSNDFPFYWLLGQTKISFLKNTQQN